MSSVSETTVGDPKVLMGRIVDVDGLTDNDVLCGKKKLTKDNPGNIRFNKMVDSSRDSFSKATSDEQRTGIASQIVQRIRGLFPSGRFLKQDDKDPKTYRDIGNQRAIHKTIQALKEGMVEPKRVMNSSAAKKSPPISNNHDGTKKVSAMVDEAKCLLEESVATMNNRYSMYQEAKKNGTLDELLESGQDKKVKARCPSKRKNPVASNTDKVDSKAKQRKLAPSKESKNKKNGTK